MKVGDVLKAVADLHGVTVAEIKGRSRKREIVAARHAAIWVFRMLDDTLTERELARLVGLAHHTTAIYAIEKVARLVDERGAYAANLWEIVDRHRGVTGEWHTPDAQPQKLPGSPDRWAIWNQMRRGNAPVKAA